MDGSRQPRGYPARSRARVRRKDRTEMSMDWPRHRADGRNHLY